MSNVMSLPGQAGTRVSNGPPIAGNAPAPANPFAAFIQAILGEFLGGPALTGATDAPAAPQVFAGLTPFGTVKQQDVIPATGGKEDEKSSPARDDGITTPCQIALISAFAPVQAQVVPAAAPVSGGTGTSTDADDAAPAAFAAKSAPASPAASPAPPVPGEGNMLLSLLKDIFPVEEAVPIPIAQADDGLKSSTAGPSGTLGGVSPSKQQAAPPIGSNGTVGVSAGSDAGSMIALALDALAEPTAPAPPAAVLLQKAEPAQSPQYSAHDSLAPARIAEVPLSEAQGDSPAQYTAPAPRTVRARGPGENSRRSADSVDPPAAERVDDDAPPEPPEFAKAAPGPRDDAAQAPPDNPAGGDGITQYQPASAAPEKGTDQQGDTAPAAAAPAKESVDAAPRAEQPVAENLTAPSQGTAARNAAQTITPPVEATGRPEPIAQAPPRQEIPAAYAPLPQEVSRRIADQVVRNLSFQVDGTASDMRMTLKPPSLGEVQLHVHVEDSKMVAQIDVSQQLVKSALEAHMPQLRQALQEHGIEVQRIDVMVPEQSMQQGGTGSGGERTGRRGGRRGATSIDDEPVQAAKDMGYNTIELIM